MATKKTFLAVLILTQTLPLFSVYEPKRVTFKQRLLPIHIVKNDEAVKTPIYEQIITSAAQVVRAVRALTGRKTSK